MAVQQPLKFGSLYLCNPSNGHDGYEITKHDLTRADYVERAIPGTAGRIKIVIGQGNTDQTSLKLEFSCQSRFSDAGDLHSFLASVERKISDTRRSLDTVEYGIKNDPAVFWADDCDMMFELKEVWVDINGFYWCDFVARFNKWGSN